VYVRVYVCVCVCVCFASLTCNVYSQPCCVCGMHPSSSTDRACCDFFSVCYVGGDPWPCGSIVEGWKPRGCPSMLTCFANDDGTSLEDHQMSNDDMEIMCKLLAPMHVVNACALFRFFNDQYFIIKCDPSLHELFPLLLRELCALHVPYILCVCVFCL
jgi:hypothetical protein